MIPTSMLARRPTARRLCLLLKDTILAFRPFLTLAVFGVLFGALAGAPTSASAQSADPVYAKGSRIGLALSPGLELSRSFPGFEDSANKVMILAAELPAQAYEATLKAMQAPPSSAPGVSNVKREILLTASGAAQLISANQEHEGTKVRKWMLVTFKAGTDYTVLVTAIVPEAASKKTYDEAAMRKIFASLSLRDQVPQQEVLGLLPFNVGDLANFSIIRPIAGGRGVLLTDEAKPDGGEKKEKSADEPGDEPEVLVTVNPGAPAQASERPRFAEQLIAGMPGIKEVRTVFSESMRIGTLPGYEIRLEAKSAKTGRDVNVVQWVRFGGSSFIHVVGVSPREKWPDSFTRFRAVRDGIGPK